MARLEEEQVKFRSTKDIFPPRIGGGRNPNALIESLLAPRPQNIQSQRTFGPGFSGTPQGTPTTGGFGDRTQPDLLSSRGEALPTQEDIPITEAGQPQAITPPRFGATAFSPGVTEITDLQRPEGASRVFTNLLSPDVIPSQEQAAEIVSGVAPLPGQLGTPRAFDATRAPIAGVTQFTGEGQLAINRLLNLPEGGVAPVADGRQTNGFGAAPAPVAAPARETQFITTEDVLRRTGDTGTGSGLVRRNAQRIAQEENAAFAQAENITTRDIGFGFREREQAVRESQLEVNRQQTETQAKQQAAKAISDASKGQGTRGFSIEAPKEELNIRTGKYEKTGAKVIVGSGKDKQITSLTDDQFARLNTDVEARLRDFINDPRSEGISIEKLRDAALRESVRALAGEQTK